MIRTRYRRILFFFARAILTVIVWDIVLSRLGLRALSRRTRPGRMRNLARQFRRLAVRMGGVMIKVGQFMSARLDVLPREITDELSGLQDEVNPESFADIRRELETSLHSQLEDRFDWFEEAPMASASIGQAHRARLTLLETKTDAGEDMPANPRTYPVVVKVQRPNIESIVATDLSALTIVSNWLHRYRPIRKHVNVPALLDELSRSIQEEMDYLNEGHNAERFAENFCQNTGVLVPRIFWETTTRKVLTLQDVQAIKITDYTAIEAAGIDRSEVADRLLNVYLQQVLEDRFFHADPHPGNLFVEPLGETASPGRAWRLVFIDFGMTGEVPADMMDGLREVIIAITTGDAARMVRADQKLNFLLPSADLNLLERAYRRVFERFSGKTTREMVGMGHREAASFAREFRQLIYDMPFQFPEDMILLGRCLSILSGMCSGLDPSFNLWISLGPFAQKLVRQEAARGLDFWLKEILDVLAVAAALPTRVDGFIRYVESGKLEVQNPVLEQKIARLERSQWRAAEAIIFGVFFFGGVQLYLAGENTLALASGALALFAMLVLLVRR
jgi:predicted unusual protein kinase regulating ubiquinone biosynthesis (AarF/ABC1/UbiB family)